MIIDPSAIVAIVRDEPDAYRFLAAIDADPVRMMATPSLLECAMVIEGPKGPRAGDELDHLLARLKIEPVAFSADHLALARQAFRRFGKGRHRAALNFGDCIAYALSKASGEPLLFKGEDFRLTDVVPAL